MKVHQVVVIPGSHRLLCVATLISSGGFQPSTKSRAEKCLVGERSHIKKIISIGALMRETSVQLNEERN